ncbi:MAG: FAD-dependent oxidoreductase [Cyanobacteria bacterium TGS_CYA1]|nr:FAD-dependent oxidoreductase [Cyanobacteria bacterium TGS_CYA1]
MNAEYNVASEFKKIVIIGGVAGGMSAAARARRLSENSRIIVFERGEHVSYANCGLPYFIGDEIESRNKLLVATPTDLEQKLNIEVRVFSEVVDIDTASTTVTVKDLKHGVVYGETYDELILAVGAAAIKPKIEGIDLPGLFAVRSVEDAESIKKWIDEYKPSKAVVAGGGFIGLEMAEQLVRRGLEVTLIDGKDQVLAPVDPEMAALVHAELKENGIKLVLGASIEGFLKPDSVKSSFAPKSCFVKAANHEPIAADLVILGLGVRPETTLAKKAGLAIGERGGIKVDDKLQTSVKHVWAVGDAIEVLNPINKKMSLIALGGPANRQGRLVADNIFGADKSYKGTLGTAILRVFNLTAASVGLNESALKDAQIPYDMVYVHPNDHASYFPGAERLDMKVLFHSNTGHLLGAQIVGAQGVDKRIDVIATAMKAGLTIDELADLELAYAPPYGSAKDPINLLAMSGSNVHAGLNKQIHWYEMDEISKDQRTCVIDVRTKKERDRGYIEGSMHIPISELRGRIAEISKEKDVVVYCQSGQRSYLAFRVLKQLGYKVRSLSGGYLTWFSANEIKKPHGSVFSLAPEAVTK